MLNKIRRTWRSLAVSYRSRKAARTVGSCGANIRVNGKSTFTQKTHLGSNMHFNGISIRGRGRVEIGDNFHSGPECIILTDSHNYKGDALPYDAEILELPVSIGKNVWLGVRVIILGGVSIGDGAIIQAGSVVVSDIPALAIAGGHPARVFSHRDEDRYSILEERGQYL